VKTSTPVQVASPLLATIAQVGAAGLTAIHHGGAFGISPAEKTAHTAEFDDRVFVVDEYKLYNEVKHGDKNSGRLSLSDDPEADEFGEFEGDDGDYSGELDEYDG
jgi:hypothetical protein